MDPGNIGNGKTENRSPSGETIRLVAVCGGTTRSLVQNYALGMTVALLLSDEGTNSVDGDLDERFVVAVIADAFVRFVVHGVVGGDVVPAPAVGTVGVRAVQDIAVKEDSVAGIEFEIDKWKTRDSRFDVFGIGHGLFIDAIVIDATNCV